MKKAIVLIILVLGLAFLGLLAVEMAKPKPVNWDRASFQSFDKDPYGAYVLFNQLSNFFPGKTVKRLTNENLKIYYSDQQLFSDLYEDYDEGYSDTDTIDYSYDADSVALANEALDSIVYFEGDLDSSAYLESEWEIDTSDFQNPNHFLRMLDPSQKEHFNLFVLNHTMDLAETDARVILQHIYQGNHVMVSSFNFYGPLASYLGIKNQFLDTIYVDSVAQSFTISVDDKTIRLKEYASFNRIIYYPKDAEILARNEAGDVLGVRIKIGKGSFTYFSMPIFFSNYYILKENNAVAEAMLLTLPNHHTYWTNYFEGQVDYRPSRSVLAFIHSQPALSWAFYTLLVSVLIFLAFQLRREQRAIPIVKAPDNISLKFTETISNLYLLNQDHKEMVIKKMSLFLEHVRTKYHVDTHVIDQGFFNRLAIKANVKETLVKHIFDRYNQLLRQDKIDDDQFLAFSNLLQNFKQHKS